MPALSRMRLEIGMTSVLDLARKRIQPEAGTTMSVQGCCAPRPSHGMTRKLVSIPLFIASHHYRNKEDLHDMVKRCKFKLGPSDFPWFFWEGEMMDEVNPADGFLHHPILFAMHIQVGFPIQQ